MYDTIIIAGGMKYVLEPSTFCIWNVTKLSMGLGVSVGVGDASVNTSLFPQ